MEKDSLSDLALRFFMDWFVDLNLGIKFLTPSEINYSKLISKKGKSLIGLDDMQMNPDTLGFSHEQDRFSFVEDITLIDRICCVIADDKIAKLEIPLVHQSVSERAFHIKDYRPESLKNKKHKIFYDNKDIEIFNSISEHESSRLIHGIFFKKGIKVSSQTFAHAYQKYNHTRIYLKEGNKYKIEVVGSERWRDGDIKNLDGKGWNRKSVKLVLKEIPIAAAEPFKRVKGAKWFELCGSINENENTFFQIGNEKIFTAPTSGELCVFANDLDGKYDNNSGKLRIKVTLL